MTYAYGLMFVAAVGLPALFVTIFFDRGEGSYDLTEYAAAVPPRPSRHDRGRPDPAEVARALRLARVTLLSRPRSLPEEESRTS